jgi:signal transduction histidine kinase
MTSIKAGGALFMDQSTTPPISRFTGRFADKELEAAFREETWPVQRIQIALTMAGLGFGLLVSLSSDFLYLQGSAWFLPTASLRGGAGMTGVLACAYLLIVRPAHAARAVGLVVNGWMGLGLAAAIMVAISFPALETTSEGLSSVLIFTAFWMSIFAIVVGFGAHPYPIAVGLFCTGLAVCYLTLAALYWDAASYPKITQSVLVLMACAFGWIMAVVSNVRTRRRFHITRLYEAAKRAAEKSEEFQVFLLAATGHDIRQPLYALDLNASALEQMAERGDLDQVRRLARRQKAVARNMSTLLSSILELSSFNLGKREGSRRAHSVDGLIRDALAPLVDLAADKGISVRHVPSRLRVDVDGGLVVHVISNLIANAISHSQGSRILLGVKRQGGFVSIIVADDGKGLSPRKTRIASMASLRDEESATRLHAGLGMEIMFSLCDRGGLKLTLVSRPGAGVTAAITCPLSSAGGADAG